MRDEDKPFEQRPVEVNGKRITYGDLRTNAHEMLHIPDASKVERGLAHALLVVLDELEARS